MGLEALPILLPVMVRWFDLMGCSKGLLTLVGRFLGRFLLRVVATECWGFVVHLPQVPSSLLDAAGREIAVAVVSF